MSIQKVKGRTTKRLGNAITSATLSIVYVNIESLVPYERNPRRNEPVVDRMVNSIEEFGFAIPILATRHGEIVDGHLRWKAAKRLKMSEVPVVYCDGWNEAQVRAFRMANRSACWAEWDIESLRSEISDLAGLGYDLSYTGFSPDEIADLQMDVAGVLRNEDMVPEKPSSPVSLLGDLWGLGKHRVLNGDAESSADVALLLNSANPFLTVTDPPYGVVYRPAWRNTAFGEANRSIGVVRNDDCADWRKAYRNFPGSVCYLFHAGVKAAVVAEGLEAAGFAIRGQLIWMKPHFAISRGDYHIQHEPIWYAVRKGASSKWRGGRKQTSVWQIGNGLSQGERRQAENTLTGHGTQKPVQCMRLPILNHTAPGDSVYDPFVGSGTTIIAAETTGRIAYAMDIDSGYVDVAIRRWQEFTGRNATLQGTNQTFDEIAIERGRRKK